MSKAAKDLRARERAALTSTRKENPVEVAIVWLSRSYDPADGDDMPLNFLSGYGGVRVFERDQYDHRLDADRDRAKDGPLPYFESVVEACAWMAKNKGEQCQIPAWKARELAK